MVWNYGEKECGICNMLCDCCEMSDVEMWLCDIKSSCGGVMWNMVWWWCEMFCDVECGCGVE